MALTSQPANGLGSEISVGGPTVNGPAETGVIAAGASAATSATPSTTAWEIRGAA